MGLTSPIASASSGGLATPRAPRSVVKKAFDPSAIHTVSLRPAPKSAHRPPVSGSRESILADIKSMQGRKGLRTPAKTIAKTTSPNRSAEKTTPHGHAHTHAHANCARASATKPEDMMSVLRARLSAHRNKIEHGSDRKPLTADRARRTSRAFQKMASATSVAAVAAGTTQAEESTASSFQSPSKITTRRRTRQLNYAPAPPAVAPIAPAEVPVVASVPEEPIAAACSAVLPPPELASAAKVYMPIAATAPARSGVDVEDSEWTE